VNEGTQAELVTTGSELLSGRTLNRHARTLGLALAELGIELTRDTSVKDEPEAVREAVAGALARAPLVFVSGGLGPTNDDITRQVLAGMLGRGLRPDPDSLERIRRVCTERGIEYNAHRARQADIIAGAEALPNLVGAAPGERLDLEGGRTLFILPGPPSEFAAVLSGSIIPWLKANTQASRRREDIYLICGQGEGDLLRRFELEDFPPNGLDTAFCAAMGRIELRVGSPAGDRALLDSARARLRAMLGEDIFAEERTEMEQVVGKLLADAGRRLAVAESCTGGMLGARITSVPGSSAWFLGGVIAYDNRIKTEMLGVDPEIIASEGAVSPDVAAALASGVRERFGADYGIGITGIAGPGGGSEEKPVGLVYIGLDDGEEVETARFQFGRGRERVRQASTQMALDLLRRRLIEAQD
jgi:nicotinamide-nucleotide amidase